MFVKKNFVVVLSIFMMLNLFAKTDFIPICYQGKYGFIDKNKEVKIPVCYEKVHYGDYDFVIAEKNRDVHVVFDTNGNEVFSSEYESRFYKISPIANNLIYVSFIADGFLFDINTKTRLCLSFSPSLSYVTDDEKYVSSNFGYYARDLKTKVFENKQWDTTYTFSDNRAVTRTFDGKWEIIDEAGNTIKFLDGQIGEKYSQGLIPFIDSENSYKSGFFDTNGNIAFWCPIFLDDDKWMSPRVRPQITCSFKEDVACVPVSENEWCVYDKAGKILFQTKEYKLAANTFSEGKICVYKKTPNGNIYLFLDKKGNQFSKYTFEKATSFYNGYAMVILEGKDALLDSSGKIIYVSDILNK